MSWVNPFSSLTLGTSSKPQHTLLEKEKEARPAVNPYHILQVRRDATTSEIRKSYRRLALLNHPGRSYDNEEQRRRRMQLFEVLAASYETLVETESRRRFDLHLSVIENLRLNKGLAGEMFVGGRRLGHNPSIMPPLVPSSSFSSCSSTSIDSSLSSDNDSKIRSKSAQTTMLILATPSCTGLELEPVPSNLSEPEIHFSTTETERLFGGPLTDLFRARNFEPFVDSLTIFERVFGSQVFDVSREEVGHLKEWEPIRSLASPSGWEGSSKTLQDGKTTIFTTSRILYDRRVTRIETIVEDPITGKRRKHTTVTSQSLDSETAQDDMTFVKCFGLCSGEGSTGKEDSSMCGDIFQTYYEIYVHFLEDFPLFGYFNRINDQ